MKVAGVPFVQGRNDYTDRDGRKAAICIHNTSNTASAEAEASYATRRTDGVSAHFYVDHDNIVQSLDTDEAAGHAGSTQANQGAIAIEITGQNGWTRDRWLNSVAWTQLARLLAQVCRHHGIPVRRLSVAEMERDGAGARGFYGHNDARLAWGQTTHTDPGPNFPWDLLLSLTRDALDGDDDMPITDADAKKIARAVWGKDFTRNRTLAGSIEALIDITSDDPNAEQIKTAVDGAVAKAMAAAVEPLAAALEPRLPGATAAEVRQIAEDVVSRTRLAVSAPPGA